MDPDGFLNALGVVPDSMAGNPIEALTSLWYQEMRRASDTIAPECLIPRGRDRTDPWSTQDFWSVKQHGRLLD